MKKLLTALVTGSAALTCLGAAPLASAQAVAHHAAAAHAAAPAVNTPVVRKPVVYSNPNFANPQVKPKHFYDITGDSSEWLNTPTWKHWNGTSAYSVGKYVYRTCFASCFRYKKLTADITLWRVRVHRNTLYYTRLKWVYVLKHHKHTVIAWFHPHARPIVWIRHP